MKQTKKYNKNPTGDNISSGQLDEAKKNRKKTKLSHSKPLSTVKFQIIFAVLVGYTQDYSNLASPAKI